MNYGIDALSGTVLPYIAMRSCELGNCRYSRGPRQYLSWEEGVWCLMCWKYEENALVAAVPVLRPEQGRDEGGWGGQEYGITGFLMYFHCRLVVGMQVAKNG